MNSNINRSEFDTKGVSAGAGFDWICVPGLHTALVARVPREDVITSFARSGVIGDLRTVLAHMLGTGWTLTWVNMLTVGGLVWLGVWEVKGGGCSR